VQRTVASVFEQTEPGSFEIILIDDGSTDGSLDFLSRQPYKHHEFIRSFRFDQLHGCIQARHQGVELAQGELIVFLDAHMALSPNWLTALRSTMEPWGNKTAVSPDITTIEPEHWVPLESSGCVMSLDEKFEMVWTDPIYPTGIVPIFGGCCVLMPRSLYSEVGGFDLGLRQWGCEFIDLCIKIYQSGGMCLVEPSVKVGHLFRNDRPYLMSYRDTNYNKLRTGYIHLDLEYFNIMADLLRDEPDYNESLSLFEQDLTEIQLLRQAQQANSKRPSDWFTKMFLNSQENHTGNNRTNLQRGNIIEHTYSGESKSGYSIKEFNMKRSNLNHFVCNQCGASNFGELVVCLNCKTPIHEVQHERITHRTCPHCGFKNKPQMKFCTDCGNDIESPVAHRDLFCTSCGKQIPQGKIFCTNCGTRL